MIRLARHLSRRAHALGLCAAALAVAGGAVAAAQTGGGERGALRATGTDGPITLVNSRDAAAIVAARGMTPGQTATGSVTLEQQGSVPAQLALAQSDLAERPGRLGGRLSAHLVLAIESVDASGTAAPVYRGRLAAFADRALGTMAAGERRTYRFRVTWPDGGVPASPNTGDNRLQDAELSVRYDWSATGEAAPVAPSPQPPAPTPPAPAPQEPPPAPPAPASAPQEPTPSAPEVQAGAEPPVGATPPTAAAAVSGSRARSLRIRRGATRRRARTLNRAGMLTDARCVGRCRITVDLVVLRPRSRAAMIRTCGRVVAPSVFDARGQQTCVVGRTVRTLRSGGRATVRVRPGPRARRSLLRVSRSRVRVLATLRDTRGTLRDTRRVTVVRRAR